MTWKQFFTSSLGKKYVMGFTGFFLIIFLIVHCTLNSMIFFDLYDPTDNGQTFNHWAHLFGTNFFIRAMEYGLFAGLLLHIIQGLILWRQNKKARPVKYAVQKYKRGKWYSRSMGLLGTLILLFLIIYLPYEKIVAALKFLCLSLLLYIAVPFFTHPDWRAVLRSTFIPTIKFNKDFIEILVAILGTTISPYLFFWQVTMEAKDVKADRQLILARRKLIRETDSPEKGVKRETKLIRLLIQKMQLDVNIGMLFSNLVMFFIILATGTALFRAGIKQIDTVEQAAKALEPVAGKASYFLFAAGVIGTGFIAIPVLSGSLSYIVSETFGWTGDLDKKYKQAKPFYIIIAISLIIGLLLNYVGVSPIQALVYTAILYGLTSPVLIAIVLHIANNKTIMHDYTNRRLSNVLGFATMIVMTVAAIALIYFQLS